VINALSDRNHPLQTLADLMTLREHFVGRSLQGKTLAWIGDGNNVLHDLMIGAVKLGMHVSVTTPLAYQPDPQIYAETQAIAKSQGVTCRYSTDPKDGIAQANVIVTDTWISMGQETEALQRKQDFAGYQINSQLMQLADPKAVFLHCLPRKSEEVSDDVFYSKQSLVFPEAENRMWTVMAVVLTQLGIDWRTL
jgi:ornithine carbamoyltransferase